MNAAAQPASFTRLSNGEDLEAIVRPQDGLISRRIFADQEIFQMEIDRIFGRGWFFLGHESEIPNPGDVIANSSFDKLEDNSRIVVSNKPVPVSASGSEAP